MGAKITKTSGLSSFDIDTKRFPKSDGVHVSPDFDTPENRMNRVLGGGGQRYREIETIVDAD